MAVTSGQGALVPQRGGRAGDGGPSLPCSPAGDAWERQQGAGGQGGGGRRGGGAGAQQHEGHALLEAPQRLLWVLPEEQRRRTRRGSLPPSLPFASTWRRRGGGTWEIKPCPSNTDVGKRLQCMLRDTDNTGKMGL